MGGKEIEARLLSLTKMLANGTATDFVPGGSCERCGSNLTNNYNVITSVGRRNSVFCCSCGYDPRLDSMSRIVPKLSA